jgi:hypothetical protein
MFKDRIKKWGLDKKNKERDMVAILHKKTQRDAVGKKSSFRVRGQVVEMENVLRYFKRMKEIPKMGPSAASTPSDISYWTPSPVHTPLPIDNGTRIDTFLPLASAGNGRDAGAAVSGWTSTPPIADDEHLIGKTYNFVSGCSKIPYSPSSPRSLLVAERLFFTIDAYFDGSFRIWPWITDESRSTPTTPGTLSLHNRIPDFEIYCRTAAELLMLGSTVKFRRALSKAINLVQDLLRDEHPRTLDRFLGVFLFLLRAGHPEIASLLRNYISEMAATVIARKHPWGDICQLISKLDAESLEQGLVQSWRCTINAFEKSLGPFNQVTLSAHIQFIRHVYASTDLVEEERLLRELLARCENVPNIPTASTTNIIINLMNNLTAQGRYTEGEQLGLVALSRAQDYWGIRRVMVNVEVMISMAYNQYQQHQAKAAEGSQRTAIEIITEYWGMNHPLVIEMMVVLEQWLRSWGRQEEADGLQAEIDKLLGRDEIDEVSFDG